MNRVFEHAGDLVKSKVAHNLMRLIAEGFGEDDDTADSQLRSSAVCYSCICSWLLTECIMHVLVWIGIENIVKGHEIYKENYNDILCCYNYLVHAMI